MKEDLSFFILHGERQLAVAALKLSIIAFIPFVAFAIRTIVRTTLSIWKLRIKEKVRHLV
jgi:hypothetical protein